MGFISVTLRFIAKQVASVFFFLRVLKLKMLYQGITIDFKSRIAGKCSIACIKGGRLVISNSQISFGTHIVADVNSLLTIEGSFIGRNCVITAKESVAIKKGCLIAEMVVIRDQDHGVDFNGDGSREETFTSAPVEIGENVWVASKATILKGVTVGKGAVVAASAVIVKDVPPYEVWGGVPGKFIKQLKHE
jgi:acetyltransferase-like isoleucine patch superfamily enzyme